jgi:hypothetical protein
MEEIKTEEAVQTVTEVKETGIVLSENEKQLIENSRRQMDAVEGFKRAYNELVQRTGFAWVVDGNSPINNPVLGVAKVN